MMAVLSCLQQVRVATCNCILHHTDPEWNPLDILHRVSTYTYKTKQTEQNMYSCELCELCLLFGRRSFSTLLAGFLAGVSCYKYHGINQSTYMLMARCWSFHLELKKPWLECSNNPTSIGNYLIHHTQQCQPQLQMSVHIDLKWEQQLASPNECTTMVGVCKITSLSTLNPHPPPQVCEHWMMCWCKSPDLDPL